MAISASSACRVPAAFNVDCHVFRRPLYQLADWLLCETAIWHEYRDGTESPTCHSDLYRKMIGGRNGSKVMEAGVEVGLFERGSSYWVGHRSKAIRLVDRYRTGEFRVVDVESRLQKDPIDIRKPALVDASKANEAPVDEVGMWLASRFPMFGFSPNIVTRNHWEAYILDQITHRRFRANRDPFGHRFHSSWTGVPRQMRNWVICVMQQEDIEPPLFSPSSFARALERAAPPTSPTCAGGHMQTSAPPDAPFSAHSTETRLVELDIRTAQPLILGTIASTEHQFVPSDLGEWLDICQTDDLYKHLAEKVANRFGVPFDRDDVKGAKPDGAYPADSVMIAVFGESKMAAKSKVGQILIEQFPTVWEYLERLRRQPKTKDCDASHKHTSQQCQRFESARMIDGVCGRLMRSHPDLPLLTVHDAAIVPRWAVKTVTDTIREEFAPYGVEPHIRKTELGAANA